MPRILPLPEDAVAQIRSSRQITGLNGVVLALLENSLDAGASKVDITVHVGQGACTVEDDGCGIFADDFTQAGGLLKMYHTSASNTMERHGHDGTFLTSLAALSLLSITSRHGDAQACSHLLSHQGRILSRCVPALPAQELELSISYSTRVSVRDLFGNMPVRVRQRAIASGSLSRLWQDLVHGIVALLMAWPRPCSIKLRDAADGRAALHIPGWHSDPNKALTKKALQELSGMSAKSDLRDALPILYQAGLAPPESRSDWVPVSASSSSVTLKGLICLQPAPTKRCQFISIGVHSLSTNREAAGLHELVNKQFGLSDFGKIEQNRDIGRGSQISGTQRAQPADRGKAVDCWPMFVLRLDLKDNIDNKHMRTELSDAWLESISSIVSAAIMQWLSIHHFRPRKQGRKWRALSASPTKRPLSQHSHRSVQESNSNPGSGRIGNHSREAAAHVMSRMRSGKRTLRRASTLPINSTRDDREGYKDVGRARPASSELHDMTRTSLVDHHTKETSDYFEGVDDADLVAIDANADIDEHDCTVWTDSKTRTTYKIDARTGNIIRHISDAERATTAPEAETGAQTRAAQQSLARQMSLPHRHSNRDEPRKLSWLPGFLKDWENPVFARQQEETIPTATFGGSDVPPQEVIQHRCNSHGNHEHISSALATSLSKDDLSKVQVISQVDGKFILCRVTSDTETLLLVDQHAASERIILERLLVELCTPAREEETLIWKAPDVTSISKHSILAKPLHFQLASEELELLRQQANRFARWGIIYDIPNATTTRQHTLVVRTLPNGIAERCRVSPNLLIDLLRSEIYNSEPVRSTPLHRTDAGEEDIKHAWLKHIGSCPKGIIDMLNSRACRSAVMFNDILSLKQCQELLADLGKCAFPFMCAHGRVSMVPLIGLGPNDGGSAGGELGHGFRVTMKGWMSARRSDWTK